MIVYFFFFFSSRRRHTRLTCDWSSDVCSSDLATDDADVEPSFRTGWSNRANRSHASGCSCVTDNDLLPLDSGAASIDKLGGSDLLAAGVEGDLDELISHCGTLADGSVRCDGPGSLGSWKLSGH